MIEGDVRRVGASMVSVAWKFPDEDVAQEFEMTLGRALTLARLAAASRACAEAPEAQVGNPVARVFDFGLESGKVYTGVVSEFLGTEGGTEEPLWRVKHLDGDSEDLDEHELARGYARLEEHLEEMKKGQKRRRELTTCASDLRSKTRGRKLKASRRSSSKSGRDAARVEARPEDDSDAESPPPEEGLRTFATPESSGTRPNDIPAELDVVETRRRERPSVKAPLSRASPERGVSRWTPSERCHSSLDSGTESSSTSLSKGGSSCDGVRDERSTR